MAGRVRRRDRCRRRGATTTTMASAACAAPSSTRVLSGRLESEGRVAHEDAAAGLGERTIPDQARDDMPSPWHGAAAHLYPMLRVEADDDTGAPVDLAVDPDLAVVVDVRLEPHARARQWDRGDAFGYGDGDPVPREGEALG